MKFSSFYEFKKEQLLWQLYEEIRYLLLQRPLIRREGAQPERIYNPITAMGCSAMFIFQLDNTKWQTLPSPHCLNGSCRYVRALSETETQYWLVTLSGLKIQSFMVCELVLGLNQNPCFGRRLQRPQTPDPLAPLAPLSPLSPRFHRPRYLQQCTR